MGATISIGEKAWCPNPNMVGLHSYTIYLLYEKGKEIKARGVFGGEKSFVYY